MKTVKRSDIQPWKMVAGNEDIYSTIIDGVYRFDWTALGWVNVGLATDDDLRQYPQIDDSNG